MSHHQSIFPITTGNSNGVEGWWKVSQSETVTVGCWHHDGRESFYPHAIGQVLFLIINICRVFDVSDGDSR